MTKNRWLESHSSTHKDKSLKEFRDRVYGKNGNNLDTPLCELCLIRAAKKFPHITRDDMLLCKKCSKCIEDFNKGRKFNIRRIHFMKSSRRQKRSLDAFNPELRMNLIQILGNNKCVRCGFGDLRALQLDHIKSDGKRDRMRFKNNNLMYFYYYDHLNEAKRKLQVLCANCNWIKRSTNNEEPWNEKISKGKLESQSNKKKIFEELSRWERQKVIHQPKVTKRKINKNN